MANAGEAREHLLHKLESENDASNGIDSVAVAQQLSMNHGEFVDEVLKGLCAREAVRMKAVDHVRWELTAEGKEYAASGSPEFAVFSFVASKLSHEGEQNGTATDVSKNMVEDALGQARANWGLQQALKRKWIAIDKATKSYKLGNCGVSDVADSVARALQVLEETGGDPSSIDEKTLKELKSRKLAGPKVFKTYLIFPGARLNEARAVQATELTREMLDSGTWKQVVFKEYNFEADGKPCEGGHLHTLLKVREQFRGIFLEMGFEEMPTNNYVESSFWNFDALFQPQQHPARDEHDTFFMSDPEFANLPDESYVRRVWETHEVGGFGSRGYRYNWSEQEARKNILRTHTTAVSSRMLYKLAQEPQFRPRKYFSIDRVFRNETLDQTHLAEFHQIEGLVADRNLSLGHLKGIIHEFFKKLGMDKLRFKPTHNPYTTPSLEIHSYHEELRKWVEVGNSGIFRPEMLRPMGIPEDVTVIAWGLSLERPTMIKYGVKNIRDLFGHKVDISAIQSNPLCRLTF